MHGTIIFPEGLYYGGARTPVAVIIPDPLSPGMWRIWCDGRLSDIGNLTRIKDAAVSIAERGPPQRDSLLLRWKGLGQPQGRPLVRQMRPVRLQAPELAGPEVQP
jgi:hypothetical protein